LNRKANIDAIAILAAIGKPHRSFNRDRWAHDGTKKAINKGQKLMRHPEFKPIDFAHSCLT
jgi:hypothetical protein